MTKKILPILLCFAIGFVAFFSCKKVNTPLVDLTRNYFPLEFGRSITYNVDSIYYYGINGTRYEIKSQLKYTVTDTFTDHRKLNYIMDVYARPYDGGDWKAISVIILTPTATELLYTQDRTQYVKLMFPIADGLTWKGNKNAQVQDTTFSYLKDWNYVYYNYHRNYFNGLVNFDNTVTLQLDDENVNYMNVDSGMSGHRTYAKEVYAYNVGMIYKEWTHYTWTGDSSQIKNGYSVTMQAIDHN
jgi:hypothetical protein